VAGWGEQRLLVPAVAGWCQPRCARAEANREDLSLPRDSNCRAATGDIEGSSVVAGGSAIRLAGMLRRHSGIIELLSKFWTDGH